MQNTRNRHPMFTMQLLMEAYRRDNCHAALVLLAGDVEVNLFRCQSDTVRKQTATRPLDIRFPDPRRDFPLRRHSISHCVFIAISCKPSCKSFKASQSEYSLGYSKCGPCR
jgi:hypothetical protein